MSENLPTTQPSDRSGLAPKPRKHLMTPGQPPRQTRDNMSVGVVQRWVLSVLAATTIAHLSMGIVVAAAYADEKSAQIGLLVISGAFGLAAVASAFLIHHKSVLTPWMILGILPPLVGAFIIFG